jgi:hypothetical protein
MRNTYTPYAKYLYSHCKTGIRLCEIQIRLCEMIYSLCKFKYSADKIHLTNRPIRYQLLLFWLPLLSLRLPPMQIRLLYYINQDSAFAKLDSPRLSGAYAVRDLPIPNQITWDFLILLSETFGNIHKVS